MLEIVTERAARAGQPNIEQHFLVFAKPDPGAAE
jgi:hypothetical protein